MGLTSVFLDRSVIEEGRRFKKQNKQLSSPPPHPLTVHDVGRVPGPVFEQAVIIGFYMQNNIMNIKNLLTSKNAIPSAVQKLAVSTEF